MSRSIAASVYQTEKVQLVSSESSSEFISKPGRSSRRRWRPPLCPPGPPRGRHPAPGWQVGPAAAGTVVGPPAGDSQAAASLSSPGPRGRRAPDAAADRQRADARGSAGAAGGRLGRLGCGKEGKGGKQATNVCQTARLPGGPPSTINSSLPVQDRVKTVTLDRHGGGGAGKPGAKDEGKSRGEEGTCSTAGPPSYQPTCLSTCLQGGLYLPTYLPA
jgi:hypothetical protein